MLQMASLAAGDEKNMRIEFTGVDLKVTIPEPIEKFPNIKDLCLHILTSCQWKNPEPCVWMHTTIDGTPHKPVKG